MFIFETFPVYQRAVQFYKDFLFLIKSKTIEKYNADQLKRALLSILLNIAEGSGKYSYKEKKNFYLIARGSAHESAALINVLFLSEIISSEQSNVWKEHLVVISKMLSGMIKSLRKKNVND